MKIRVKFGSLPGDVPKRVKIAALEGKPGRLNRRQAKSYKRQKIRSRERAVFKEQTRHCVENQLTGDQNGTEQLGHHGPGRERKAN